MGLENGIFLHSPKTIAFPKELGVIDEYPHKGDFVYELGFWCSCWGLRNAISTSIYPEDTTDIDGVPAYKVYLDDIKDIWFCIQNLNNKAAWEDGQQNSLSYKEVSYNLNETLLRLEWLIEQLSKGELQDCWVEWMDSY